MTEQSAAQIEARRTIMRTLFGTMVTQAVGVAARWELADAIGDGEAAAADLARVYDIPEERLNRLLRVLACLGLCVERTPGRYALTEAGYLLRKDNPNSLLDLTRLLTHQTMQEAWLHLETSMRTGRPAFDDVFGTPVFTYLGERPELSALFNSAMSQRTKGDGVAATLPQRYDFGRFSRVTDVGGGDGTLLTTILKHHPSLRGVVFDTPEGVAQASKTVEGPPS
nr:hypothetical protein GCM10020241_63960 [Streptoalloteichus tenebrarius]